MQSLQQDLCLVSHLINPVTSPCASLCPPSPVANPFHVTGMFAETGKKVGRKGKGTYKGIEMPL